MAEIYDVSAGSGAPTISVIMPVFNASEFLKEACCSILDQSFRDFEFIIINDGSTDDSLEILEEIARSDHRVRVYSTENRGIVNALNTGISLARGMYLARMDADDYSSVDRLQSQLQLMVERGLDVCGCSSIVIDERGEELWSVEAAQDPAAIMFACVLSVPFSHGCAMIRRRFLEESGLRYTDDWKSAEDKRLWLDCVNVGAVFGNCTKKLYLYRVHRRSKTWLAARETAVESIELRRLGFDSASSRLKLAFDSLLVDGSSLSRRDRELASEIGLCLKHGFWTLIRFGFRALLRSFVLNFCYKSPGRLELFIGARRLVSSGAILVRN